MSTVNEPIDLEKIRTEEKYDGFFGIVTSELDWGERTIRQTYAQLWKIEQSFRITKSDLSSRPVYVQLDSRIRAHFFICHVSLLILRLFELALGQERISSERIQNVLRHCTLDELTSGILHLHGVGGKQSFTSHLDAAGSLVYTLTPSGHDEIYSDFTRILAAFNLPLDFSYIRREQFDKAVQNATLALQK
ncbi:MAG: hypothetical protein Q4D98_10390 [Planctomycetia bacterium]|nr:hypothetical protein [Planctomycetia bacterium]